MLSSMKYANRTFTLAAVLLFASFMTGCLESGETPPETAVVKGKVTYQSKPVSDATIVFFPKSGPVATGKTDAEGNYTLKTNSADGASIGDHQVTVSPPSDSSTSSGEISYDLPAKSASKSALPSKYSDKETSGITKTVKAGEENTINIELTD